MGYDEECKICYNKSCKNNDQFSEQGSAFAGCCNFVSEDDFKKSEIKKPKKIMLPIIR